MRTAEEIFEKHMKQFRTGSPASLDYYLDTGNMDDKLKSVVHEMFQEYASQFNTVEPEKKERCNCKFPNETGVVCSKCPLPY